MEQNNTAFLKFINFLNEVENGNFQITNLLNLFVLIENNQIAHYALEKKSNQNKSNQNKTITYYNMKDNVKLVVILQKHKIRHMSTYEYSGSTNKDENKIFFI